MVMTVNVPKSKVPFMKTMFSNLSFVEPDSVSVYDEMEEFRYGIRKAVREVKAYMRGEIELRSTKELIDEH
jgi:hypothetical protein